jgi:hypothetical protein
VNDLIQRLSRDERAAAKTLGKNEARYLVDLYYQIQGNRIVSNNQVRAAEKQGEPNAVLGWFAENHQLLENQIKTSLDVYASNDPVGAWMQAQVGIGPVIAAGFLCRLELRPTVGAWWRFCGLDPSSKWEKGQKRPWNADLKRLCWIAGESFVKTSNHPRAYYGRLYRERKDYEIGKNLRGEYAAQAAATLATGRYVRDTGAKAAYSEGRLPDAQIHRRSARWAVKLFLSHVHDVWHRHELGVAPPMPYPIAHLGHAHYLPVPHAAE